MNAILWKRIAETTINITVACSIVYVLTVTFITTEGETSCNKSVVKGSYDGIKEKKKISVKKNLIQSSMIFI